MSKKSFFKIGILVLVLSLALPLAACRVRQANITNFVDLPVYGAKNNALAQAQVRKAILDACKKRNWVAREISPGLISATREVRGKHMARVEIPFSGTRYSIIYKDSSNLQYDASKNVINRNYNSWVNYLRQDIEMALAQAG